MLQPGTIFDSRYELVRMIGRGGFAEVWLVKDTLTGLEEALKIYAPGNGIDEDGLKIFVKELIVAHDLHHPHLLTPNMLGQYERQPYLIMQYCPNGSLNKKVGKCTEEEAWKILEHVASGLAYLHEQGVVHQDIKPDNILKDAKGNYVITDFGISLRARTTLRKSMRVQANSGTMAYMAPERFSAEPHPIPANDIWSLGAMMFELIEGKVPYPADMGGLAQKKGADLPNMHAEVSDNLKQLICLLMDLDASHRPSAEELVGQVKKATATENSDDEEITVKEPANRGWIAWVVIIAIASSLGYGISQWVKSSGSKQSPPAAVQSEYVDLGLPSGTLWKKTNETGEFYTYDEAIAQFGDSLPTKKQMEELKNKCTWTWDSNGNFCKVVGPNGHYINIQAYGFHNCSGALIDKGTYGDYWSSTGEGRKQAWSMGFYSEDVVMLCSERCSALSVRLVR